MFDKVKMVVEAAIKRQDPLLDNPIDISNGESSPLYGSEGAIDSLTLVSIIVDIEDQIQRQFGVEVRLADTGDLPQSATPFATLGAMSEYVTAKLFTALESAKPKQFAIGCDSQVA